MSNMDPTRVMGAGVPGMDRTLVGSPGAQATMVMPGQGDAYRTQMGGTTTCPVCKSTTPLMEHFCGDCGFLLASSPAEEIAVPTEEAPAGEIVDPQTGRRFRLRSGVNTVGRHGTDILVDDGTVSRNHAQITVSGDSAMVEDLGSSNGTKVGDSRLAPNQPVQAVSGTALRFGNWNVVLQLTGAGGGAASATIAMPASTDFGKTLVGTMPADEDTMTMSRELMQAEVAPPPNAVEAATGQIVDVEYARDTMSAGPGTESDSSISSPALLRRIEGPGDDICLMQGVVSIGRRPENTIVLAGDAYISGRHAEVLADGADVYLTDVGSTNGTVLNGAKVAPNQRILLSPGDEVHIGQSKFRLEAPEAAAGPAEDAAPFDLSVQTEDGNA